MSYVYLLLSTGNAAHVGATVNVERRVRQHNRELKGGAKSCGIRVKKGETWSPLCYVKNFSRLVISSSVRVEMEILD